jgi:hypothetical protein
VTDVNRSHSTLSDALQSLAQFEAHVRRLPTASVHDVNPVLALVSQAHGLLRSVIAPLVVDPADADPRVLAGVESHLVRVA